MSRFNFKKMGVAVLVFAVVIAGAIVLGTQAGNFYSERRSLERRDQSTTSMLSEMQTLEIGGKLTDHTFENLEGDDVRLSDLVTGRTIVCFFDIDCGGCLLELEEMQAALDDSLRRHVILISHDDRVDLMEARAVYNIEAVILWDQDAFYSRNMKVQVRPFNVVVDSALTIRKIVAGKLTGSEFREFMSD